LIKCQFCFKKRWLTAGTFFHRIRRARPWLAAIFLIEHGVAFNSFQFHRLLGIAYSSALSILKKVSVVIQSAMRDDDFIRLPSALFLPLFTKRSRKTPANKKPLAEEEAMHVASADDDISGERELSLASIDAGSHFRDGQVKDSVRLRNDFREATEHLILDPSEKAIYECLSLKPTHCDLICERVQMSIGQVSAALTLLELSGIVWRLPGDHYVRCEPAKAHESTQKSLEGLSNKALVDSVITFTRNSFRGISRKYLQNYISVYWCYVDKARWNAGSLLELCIGFRPVAHEEILAYVSPSSIQIATVGR
jgi:hypothetical protein